MNDSKITDCKVWELVRRTLFIFSFASFFFFLFFSGYSVSQAEESWEEAKANLENLNCEDTWNVLWTFAKQGNLEARFVLFVQLVPPPLICTQC